MRPFSSSILHPDRLPLDARDMDDIDPAFNPARKTRKGSSHLAPAPDVARLLRQGGAIALPPAHDDDDGGAARRPLFTTPVVYLYLDRLSNAFARWAVRPILTMHIGTLIGPVKHAAE